ncbi:MAG: EAL domain-containing protein, partial [Bacilli bacterium]|nr:EAL domain-containing protein [Bacilli bacterium]
KLNSLKLDRSLCENIEKSSQNYDLISGICLLCKRIGVEVIADYISNEKQRELFEELGIKYGRGDLFSPELTLDELIDKFYKTGNYFDFREEEKY